MVDVHKNRLRSMGDLAGSSGCLKAATVAVEELTDFDMRGMWNVFRQYYADVTSDKFRADLSKKSDVILLLDSGDNSIQGFSTIEVYEREHAGKSYLAVFSGDTIVDEKYWGQNALQREFVRYVIRLKLKNIFRPVYWFLISKGYKTYLLLSRNYWTYWPRHDKATPALEKGIIQQLAIEKYGDAFEDSSGILKFLQPEGRLKRGVAPIDEKLLRHPDIAFFCDQNPGHEQGDELCCLGRIDGLLWLRFTSRLISKLFRISPKRAKSQTPRPRVPSTVG